MVWHYWWAAWGLRRPTFSFQLFSLLFWSFVWPRKLLSAMVCMIFWTWMMDALDDWCCRAYITSFPPIFTLVITCVPYFSMKLAEQHTSHITSVSWNSLIHTNFNNQHIFHLKFRKGRFVGKVFHSVVCHWKRGREETPDLAKARGSHEGGTACLISSHKVKAVLVSCRL